MLKSKYNNPLTNFVAHGVKTVGNYSYVLLVDEMGQALIQQISSDQTTILFNLMADPGTDQRNLIAQAITNFWVNPATGPFVYLFELQSAS